MRSSSWKTHGLAGSGRPASSRAHQALSAGQAAEIAVEAYVYGYPLVLMDVTRQVATAASKAGEQKAPVNQFAQRGERVTAWLDLRKGPLVLSLPATGERYCLMALLDAWTNVFSSLDTRAIDPDGRDFAILGPRWRGRLLMGVPPIVAPTHMVWLIGRTQTLGKEDRAAVHALQDPCKLTPMSVWGTPYTPSSFVPVARGIDVRTPPPVQVARMDAAAFFVRLNELMVDNPPAAADAGAMERFEAIGVAPGRPLDFSNLDPVVAEALGQSVPAAQAIIGEAARRPHALHTVAYGTDYLRRAAAAHAGLGANLPEDAVDSRGRPCPN